MRKNKKIVKSANNKFKKIILLSIVGAAAAAFLGVTIWRVTESDLIIKDTIIDTKSELKESNGFIIDQTKFGIVHNNSLKSMTRDSQNNLIFNDSFHSNLTFTYEENNSFVIKDISNYRVCIIDGELKWSNESNHNSANFTLEETVDNRYSLFSKDLDKYISTDENGSVLLSNKKDSFLLLADEDPITNIESLVDDLNLRHNKSEDIVDVGLNDRTFTLTDTQTGKNINSNEQGYVYLGEEKNNWFFNGVSENGEISMGNLHDINAGEYGTAYYDLLAFDSLDGGVQTIDFDFSHDWPWDDEQTEHQYDSRTHIQLKYNPVDLNQKGIYFVDESKYLNIVEEEVVALSSPYYFDLVLSDLDNSDHFITQYSGVEPGESVRYDLFINSPETIEKMELRMIGIQDITNELVFSDWEEYELTNDKWQNIVVKDLVPATSYFYVEARYKRTDDYSGRITELILPPFHSTLGNDWWSEGSPNNNKNDGFLFSPPEDWPPNWGEIPDFSKGEIIPLNIKDISSESNFLGGSVVPIHQADRRQVIKVHLRQREFNPYEKAKVKLTDRQTGTEHFSSEVDINIPPGETTYEHGALKFELLGLLPETEYLVTVYIDDQPMIDDRFDFDQPMNIMNTNSGFSHIFTKTERSILKVTDHEFGYRDRNNTEEPIDFNHRIYGLMDLEDFKLTDEIKYKILDFTDILNFTNPGDLFIVDEKTINAGEENLWLSRPLHLYDSLEPYYGTFRLLTISVSFDISESSSYNDEFGTDDNWEEWKGEIDFINFGNNIFIVKV